MADQRKSTAKKTSTGRKTAKSSYDKNVKDTIALLVIVAVALLMFLSNLGIGGVVGGGISNILFGLFGLFSYIFPFALIYIGFSIVNMTRNTTGFAIVKVVCGIIFVLFICMFMNLVVYQSKVATPAEAFRYGFEQHNGGGFFGGILTYFITPAFGLIGSYVIDILVLLVSIVLIFEKTPILFMRRKSEELKETSRERMQERREERRLLREQEQQMREAELQRELEHLEQQQNSDAIPVSSEAQPVKQRRNIRRRAERHVFGVTGNTEIPKDSSSEQAQAAAGLQTVTGYAALETPAGNISQPSVTRQSRQKLESDDMQEIFGREIVWPDAETAEVDNIPSENIGKVEFSSDPEECGNGSAERNIRISGLVNGDAPEINEDNILNDKLMEQALYQNALVDEEVPVTSSSDDTPRETSTEDRADSGDTGRHFQVDVDYSHYQLPSPDILDHSSPKKGAATESELHSTADLLEQTLMNFGVDAKVTDISCGPAVTRYEIQPAMGVKVSKIVNLADDLKLNLAAADIRIEAPIPGKAAVGIEVPNKENVAVPFREVIETQDFKNHKSKIAFGVGKDIGGNVVVTDIAKMPHMLIAGATGSGKSVCINTLIMSILFKAKPDEVKLLMIDPKVVELSVYNGIPHLLMPVVTNPKLAAQALQAAVIEMDQRYQKFAEKQVRDMAGYNSAIEKEGGKKLPQIVIVVDELADLMMVASGDVEEAICRLAQLARAAGIHLVIATQRPSVNVITGLIKANMPSRIAFAVTSSVDSRTILDMGGAEKLLGKGDMLYYPQGLPKPIRVQGAWVKDEEVERVLTFIREQATYIENNDFKNHAEQAATSGSTPIGDGMDVSDGDVLMAEAARVVVGKEKASIGMLQRYLKIGFNRAARIMDELEENGIVGPEMGTKPRTVQMTPEELEIWLEENG